MRVIELPFGRYDAPAKQYANPYAYFVVLASITLTFFGLFRLPKNRFQREGFCDFTTAIVRWEFAAVGLGASIGLDFEGAFLVAFLIGAFAFFLPGDFLESLRIS